MKSNEFAATCVPSVLLPEGGVKRADDQYWQRTVPDARMRRHRDERAGRTDCETMHSAADDGSRPRSNGPVWLIVEQAEYLSLTPDRI